MVGKAKKWKNGIDTGPTFKVQGCFVARFVIFIGASMSRNVSGGAYEVVRDAIASYQRQADKEPWQNDHDAAMRCFDLEEILWVGNGIFDVITQFDENNQSRCLSGAVEYDPELTNSIKDLYRTWFESGSKFIPRLERCRKEFGHVANSEGFLSRRREAEGILTEDSVYFSSRVIVDLRDEALDEFRAGNVDNCSGCQ